MIGLARARDERADALSAAEALELATLGGARALGLEHEIGSLVPGKRADVAIVSLSGSPYLPWEDPAAAVVYGGAPERVAGYPRRRRSTIRERRVRVARADRRSVRARGRMLRPTTTSATATS